MAKLIEEVIVITLSRLVKGDCDETTIINTELLSTLETVASELVGDRVVVEANRSSAR